MTSLLTYSAIESWWKKVARTVARGAFTWRSIVNQSSNGFILFENHRSGWVRTGAKLMLGV